MTAEQLRTVRQVAKRCPGFTEPAVRKLIFDAERNGLAAAIVRIGRRVFIDLEKFDEWLEKHRAA